MTNTNSEIADKTMADLVPAAYTFAALAAENDTCERLKKHLQHGLFGHQRIGNSFFILNIDRQYAMKLGLQYGMETIVWSQKRGDDSYTIKNVHLLKKKNRNKEITIPYNALEWKSGSGAIKKTENMPEWFIKQMNDLAKSSLNLFYTGKKRYYDRGKLLSELRKFEKMNDNPTVE